MKKFWMVLLILAVVGIVLMACGFSLGAYTNLSLDRNGLNYGGAEKMIDVNETNIGQITEIDIDMAAANVEIIPGPDYGYEIHSTRNNPITHKFENGKLTISQNLSFSWRLFSFNFDFSHDSVKIYLPPEAFMQNVSVRTASGKIYLSSMNCDRFNLSSSSGKIDAKDVTATDFSANCTSGKVSLDSVKADRFNLVLTSGQLTANNINSGTLSATLTSGSAKLSGQFLGSTNISMTSGSVNMDIDGKREDYRTSASTVSGSVRVNGEKLNDQDRNSSAPYSLNVDVISGGVRINYAR